MSSPSTDRACERCDHTDPDQLNDRSALPFGKVRLTDDSVERDRSDAVLVCEECLEEYRERADFERAPSIPEFVNEPVERSGS